jgi:hypothetical protein
MHINKDRDLSNPSCFAQDMDRFPSKFMRLLSAKKQQSHHLSKQTFHSDSNAGPWAGVFFGRLIRRFGCQPSRRISGPSAEFISVTRLRTLALAVSRETAPVGAPLFAPMNNPYRSQRAEMRTGFFKPGT